VCGLGKFGGRELTVSSDLDLMLVYDSDSADGALLATRFVQRLVAALTAPTEEGLLYEVDMQLRPSGRAGPVAVRFPAFEAYYRGDAWTWEFMALTRLRPVAGDRGLGDRITASAREALIAKSADRAITADVIAMRQRLAKERPARSRWDVKLAVGGLVDVEFLIQHEILGAAETAPDVITANSLAAIDALEAAGRFDAPQAATLREALGWQLALQQALRIATGDGFDPQAASDGLKAWLARHMGAVDFEALERDLVRLQSLVEALCARKLAP
jgi:glutamate-ammonia-ligase adenylyltransferase